VRTIIRKKKKSSKQIRRSKIQKLFFVQFAWDINTVNTNQLSLLLHVIWHDAGFEKILKP
jgi:hypothetical protein